MIFIMMVIEYYKDVKMYGKDNLCVSFRERLYTYILFVLLPALAEFILGLKE